MPARRPDTEPDGGCAERQGDQHCDKGAVEFERGQVIVAGTGRGRLSGLLLHLARLLAQVLPRALSRIASGRRGSLGPVPRRPGARRLVTSTCEAQYQRGSDERRRCRQTLGHRIASIRASGPAVAGVCSARPGRGRSAWNLGRVPKSPEPVAEERQPTENGTRAFALSQCALWHMLRQVIQKARPRGHGQSPGSVQVPSGGGVRRAGARGEGRWPAIRRHVPDWARRVSRTPWRVADSPQWRLEWLGSANVLWVNRPWRKSSGRRRAAGRGALVGSNGLLAIAAGLIVGVAATGTLLQPASDIANGLSTTTVPGADDLPSVRTRRHPATSAARTIRASQIQICHSRLPAIAETTSERSIATTGRTESWRTIASASSADTGTPSLRDDGVELGQDLRGDDEIATLRRRGDLQRALAFGGVRGISTA